MRPRTISATSILKELSYHEEALWSEYQLQSAMYGSDEEHPEVLKSKYKWYAVKNLVKSINHKYNEQSIRNLE